MSNDILTSLYMTQLFENFHKKILNAYYSMIIMRKYLCAHYYLNIHFIEKH